MAVATPLSLDNIVNEFGLGEISTQTFESGSGTVTAPADASVVIIKAWGGGGGGGAGDEDVFENDLYGGGGGSGAYSEKTVAVTGGSTSISYSVGAGGAASGGDAGTSSASIGGVTQVSAGGGFGGDDRSAGGGGGVGGTASSGTINTSGNAGTNGVGSGYGGAALNNGYGAGGDGGFGPIGRGGAGVPGDSGAVVLKWFFKGLSTYTRGSGEIANHAANASIPTSASNLGISQFSGAEKSFTATITSADISGTQDPPSSYATRGYRSGLNGSINRDQVGTNDNNLNTTTLLEVVETPGYDFFFNAWNFTVSAKFSGDVRSATLGYDFFSSLSINGVSGGTPQYSTQSFDGTNTSYTFIAGFSQGFGADGSSNSVELVYGGP